MRSFILGKKLGMTSLFTEDGKHVPCTVVEAGPCPITQLRTQEKDGYKAVQVGFGEIAERKVNKPGMGHYAKAGVKPTRYLQEFRDPAGTYQVGEELTVEQFQKGDKVKVTGKSKGKGFQGVVRRHHFGGVGMTTHGQSDRQRHPGSVGSSSYPSRVFKGLRMAGRMGGKKISVRNIEVVEIIPDKNLLLLKGSLPGAPNSLVQIIKL